MGEESDMPSHDSGTRRGEDIAEKDEAGRRDTGTTDTGRPTGESDARFSTGINAEDENPIDPDSPELPPA